MVVVKGSKWACKTTKLVFAFGGICMQRCPSECETRKGEFGPVSFVIQDVLY